MSKILCSDRKDAADHCWHGTSGGMSTALNGAESHWSNDICCYCGEQRTEKWANGPIVPVLHGPHDPNINMLNGTNCLHPNKTSPINT